MRYDPGFGYTCMPAMKSRVIGPGGSYLIRTNQLGFRSDREFSDRAKRGTYRALLFGDSQTAGDGVGNENRFSDLLEQELPDLEIYNYALSGTSIDQHFLIYNEHASVDHDLVIIAFYVENILRVRCRVVKGRAENGAEVFREKPFYQIAGDRLVLNNVPVRKQPWTAETLPEELRPHVYSFGDANLVFRNQSRWHGRILKGLAPFGPLRRWLKLALARLRGFHPLGDYDDPSDPSWQLLRKILVEWTSQSSKPVLLALIPLESAIDGLSDPRNYQKRFSELAAETGCLVHDLLPDLKALSKDERRSLWSYKSGHLSTLGHRVIAHLMAPVIRHILTDTSSAESGIEGRAAASP